MESRTRVRAGLGPSAKAEDVIDAKPADSGALLLEAGTAYQVRNVGAKE